MFIAETVKKKRIFYFDALRALAIISVVLVHVYMFASHHVGDYFSTTMPSYKWIVTDFMVNFFRIGVPLFLMLSGALSLGRDWTIRSFLGKRLPRIVGPYLFWGFLLSLFIIAVSYIFHFKYMTSFDINSIVVFIYNAYNCKSPGFYAYWFFWMILGTYLIMPVFNKWLLHSELKEAEYFLIFWIITCIFDFTLGISFPVKLSYFTSPIGLVVLGYYLRHTDRRIFNNIYFAMFLIVAMAVVMVFVSHMLSDADNLYTFDRYSIFTALEVIGVFILFKNWKYRILDKDNIINRFIVLVAKYSYGIYLVHVPFILILDKFIHLPFILKYALLFALGLACSMIVLGIFNRIPYVNRIIGVK